jgi:hypothetical protein
MERLRADTTVKAEGALAALTGHALDDRRLEEVLAQAGITPTSWAGQIAALLVESGDATCQELAVRWAKRQPHYPGREGRYHQPDAQGRTLRTPEQSYRYGVYRAVRHLRDVGLVQGRPEYRILSVIPLREEALCNWSWKHSDEPRPASWAVKVLSPDKAWTWKACDSCRDRLLDLYQFASTDQIPAQGA